MKRQIFIFLSGVATGLIFYQCAQQKEAAVADSVSANEDPASAYGGFDSEVKWGEHLVTIGVCNDCHTPKKMTPEGLHLDSALLLSGHPANMSGIQVDRKEIESKGYTVRHVSEWAGPWGVSYAANLTPDETGLGPWTEAQFFKAMREGKYKGLDGSRTLLPPMPWQMYRHMTDDELRAVFAFLKSIKPVSNIVPAPLPPASRAN